MENGLHRNNGERVAATPLSYPLGKAISGDTAFPETVRELESGVAAHRFATAVQDLADQPMAFPSRIRTLCAYIRRYGHLVRPLSRSEDPDGQRF